MKMPFPNENPHSPFTYDACQLYSAYNNFSKFLSAPPNFSFVPNCSGMFESLLRGFCKRWISSSGNIGVSMARGRELSVDLIT